MVHNMYTAGLEFGADTTYRESAWYLVGKAVVNHLPVQKNEKGDSFWSIQAMIWGPLPNANLEEGFFQSPRQGLTMMVLKELSSRNRRQHATLLSSGPRWRLLKV